MAKTSTELVEHIGGLLETVREKAIRETREDVALAVEEQFLGRRNVSRSTYCGQSPDACILQFLDEDVTVLRKEPQIRAVMDRFADEGVSSDFRAGILFACRLFADPEYDY